jgi:hypothetical protein
VTGHESSTPLFAEPAAVSTTQAAVPGADGLGVLEQLREQHHRRRRDPVARRYEGRRRLRPPPAGPGDAGNSGTTDGTKAIIWNWTSGR